MNCVIGPSHLVSDMIASQNAQELFENYDIFGIHGLANWSDVIPKYLKAAHEQGFEITWVVSNWLFNNQDINLIEALPVDTLFLPGTRGSRNNICRELMETKHITILASHTIKILDYIVERFPKIKLVFWCLYQRTRNTVSTSIPYDYSYDAMMNRYPDNTVNIVEHLIENNSKFSDCIIDAGGHPNYEGYTILKHCISS